MENLNSIDISNLTESENPEIQKVATAFFKFIARQKRFAGFDGVQEYFETDEFQALLEFIEMGEESILSNLRPFLENEEQDLDDFNLDWNGVVEFVINNSGDYLIKTEKKGLNYDPYPKTEAGVKEAFVVSPEVMGIVIQDIARTHFCTVETIIGIVEPKLVV